jgi:hypothetical protein
MSNLLHKVKEAIPGTHSNKASEPEGANGPHSSRAANAADPRIDSDRDNRAAGVVGGAHSNTTHTTGTTGTTGTNYTHGSGQTTAGPHSSNVANKLDPRVDSDRDNSRTVGSNPTTGTHGTTTHTGVGHTGTTGTTHTSGNIPEGTVGPHSSRVANAADPRVDSDLDSSRNRTTGTSGLTSTTHGTHGSSGLTGTTHGTHGSSGLTGTTHGTHGTTGSNIPEGTAGPHSSRVANAADPRVDSDLDSSRNRGTYGTTGTSGLTGTTHGTTGTSGLTGTTHGTTGTSGLTGTTHGTHGTTGSNIPEGTAGPHSSRVANAADPRVDSDLDSSRNRHAGTTGGTGLTTGTNTTHHTGVTGSHAPGPAPDTAGPHKSNLLNKVDPRVDSDLDGSKTVGGNKTFNQS